MTDIRYWSAVDGATSASSQKKETAKTVDRYLESFQSALLGQLTGAETSPSTGTTGGKSITELLGRKTPGLGANTDLIDMDIDGIEKVWAAQLSSPLGFFNNDYTASNKSQSGLGALDSIVSLTVQEQLVKARKELERGSNLSTVSEFVDRIAGLEEKNGQSGDTDSGTLDDFISNLRQQIDAASGRYGINADDILAQLKTRI